MRAAYVFTRYIVSVCWCVDEGRCLGAVNGHRCEVFVGQNENAS